MSTLAMMPKNVGTNDYIPLITRRVMSYLDEARLIKPQATLSAGAAFVRSSEDFVKTITKPGESSVTAISRFYKYEAARDLEASQLPDEMIGAMLIPIFHPEIKDEEVVDYYCNALADIMLKAPTINRQIRRELGASADQKGQSRLMVSFFSSSATA